MSVCSSSAVAPRRAASSKLKLRLTCQTSCRSAPSAARRRVSGSSTKKKATDVRRFARASAATAPSDIHGQEGPTKMSENPTATASATPRLKQQYQDQIKAQLAEQLDLGNVMRIGRAHV